MKYRHANRDVARGQKMEPRAQAVRVGGVSEIGVSIASKHTDLYAGKGYMAPKPVARDTHRSGSQGKHK